MEFIMKKFGLSLLALIPLANMAQAKARFDRKTLLSECHIPEHRDFLLSKEIQPCDNFYEYVCSEEKAKFKMPLDRSTWGFATRDSHERILCAKKKYFTMLENGAEPLTARMKPVKDLYLSCMNPEKSALNEKDFVGRELANIAKISDKKQMMTFLQNRMNAPVAGVVSYGLVPNQLDPNKQDIIFQPTLKFLPEKSFLQNKLLMDDFKSLAEKFFTEVGMDQPEKRAKWVFSYELGMQHAFPTPTEIRYNFTQNTYRERKHFQRYKNLGLDTFINKLPEEVQIRDLLSPSLLYLDHWLSEASLEEIKSVWAFYQIRDEMDDAYPKFNETMREIGVKYFGSAAERPKRQERCTQLVANYYPMELDAELIEILFADFPEQKVVNLAEKIRESILNGLNKNTWMDEETKKEAKAKITKAQLYLVKPQKESDWDFLSDVSLDVNKPIDNKIAVAQAYLDKKWKKVFKKREKSVWDMSPLTLNAYYHPADNKFVLLQGILQNPIFNPESSDIENLAAIGSIIGHELGHSIDDKGAMFDSEGRLRNWFSQTSLEAFRQRGAKFISQYDAMGHNGQLTLGENIGDHVGLFFSYDAAFLDGKDVREEDQKKFFESYARNYCGVSNTDRDNVLLKTDSHSLWWARVNGQVIHHPAFQHAYACKKGDKMYLSSEEQIKVW